jgi:hypothetical protein
MGLYPVGDALGVFLLAMDPTKASELYPGENTSDCVSSGATWVDVIAAGCPEPVIQLASRTNSQALLSLLDKLGLFIAPTFPVETLSTTRPQAISDVFNYIQGIEVDPVSGTSLQVSPLQMALASASLSNGGEWLAPRLAMKVENPHGGWVMLPFASQHQQALPVQAATIIADAFTTTDSPIWQVVATNKKNESTTANYRAGSTSYTWYLGGTVPEWKGASLAAVVLLEEDNRQVAQEIGHLILQKALYP